MTGRFKDGSQPLGPRPLQDETDGGGVAPIFPEGRDQLGLGAQHPGGHLVGCHHGDFVAVGHGNELLGEAVEEACPLQEFVKQPPERSRHAVDHQQADPRVGRQEVRQQVELGQQLHVVMATHLREPTQTTSE